MEKESTITAAEVLTAQKTIMGNLSKIADNSMLEENDDKVAVMQSAIYFIGISEMFIEGIDIAEQACMTVEILFEKMNMLSEIMIEYQQLD